MSQAIVDPAELRRFAHQLKHFNAELQGQMSALNAQLASLGTSWRDQENERFVSEFEVTAQALKRFIDSSSQHIPFLLRKADRIEEYLHQR